MSIKDGLKLIGRPAEILDCTRNDLPQFFLDMGYKVGAEIGVYKGEFTEKFCRAGLKMYAIDPWLSYQDYAHPKGQKRMDFICGHAQRLLSRYDCTVIKKNSMEAINDFEDESLDFVHIDGNHRFKYVAEDICGWSKKVKKGGVVSGHCYSAIAPVPEHDKSCQAKFVVDAYAKAFNILNWYVIGRPDGWLSWFWIKS